MAGTSSLLLAPAGERGSGMGVGPVGAGPPPLLALGGWPGLDTLRVNLAEAQASHFPVS